MKAIDPPIDVSFSDLFELCVANKHEPARTSLRNSFAAAAALGESYLILAQTGQLHDLQPLYPKAVPAVQKDKLNKLYDERLAKNGSPGRTFYDQILIANRGRCPFCNHGRSGTVDHFLPKDCTKFPELSVFPANLVPACRDCNSIKSTHYGKTLRDQLFHPYFDDPDQEQWLSAAVTYFADSELTVTFCTTFHHHDEDYSHRVSNQFKRLKLNAMYSVQAASELEDIRPSLTLLHNRKGKLGVVQKIREDSDSYTKARPNSWKAALYRELLSNTIFSDMNWTL